MQDIARPSLAVGETGPVLHNPTWWQKTSWSVIALGLPAQGKQIHGCDRTMDTGACAYWATSELNAGCEPLCLVASSTTLPQYHAAFFLYCVDYVDNFIWSELCGEKRRGNPSLAWKHWQNEPKPATKTQAEGLPWLKGRRGKQEVVEFHVPFDACNPRLSKLKARFKLKHFRPPWLVKTKSSNRNSNYKTQPAHMCSLHKSTERERGRARVRLGLCMGFVHFHDAKIEVESFLQANSGYTKRVTRLTSH